MTGPGAPRRKARKRRLKEGPDPAAYSWVGLLGFLFGIVSWDDGIGHASVVSPIAARYVGRIGKMGMYVRRERFGGLTRRTLRPLRETS